MRLATEGFHQISPGRRKVAIRSYSLSSFFGQIVSWGKVEEK